MLQSYAEVEHRLMRQRIIRNELALNTRTIPQNKLASIYFDVESNNTTSISDKSNRIISLFILGGNKEVANLL